MATNTSPRLEFGYLACTAGLPGPACGCTLCALEDVTVALRSYRPGALYDRVRAYSDYRPLWIGMDMARGPDETVIGITQVPPAMSDTLSNTEPLTASRENEMTTGNLFNPQGNDGAATYMGLRLIPVALVLAAIFQALVS